MCRHRVCSHGNARLPHSRAHGAQQLPVITRLVGAQVQSKHKSSDKMNSVVMERPCDSILGNDPIFQNRWLFSNQWKFLDRSSLHLAKLIFGNPWHGLQSLHKSITWKFLQLGSFQNPEVSLTRKFPELGSFSNLEVSL